MTPRLHVFAAAVVITAVLPCRAAAGLYLLMSLVLAETYNGYKREARRDAATKRAVGSALLERAFHMLSRVAVDVAVVADDAGGSGVGAAQGERETARVRRRARAAGLQLAPQQRAVRDSDSRARFRFPTTHGLTSRPCAVAASPVAGLTARRAAAAAASSPTAARPYPSASGRWAVCNRAGEEVSVVTERAWRMLLQVSALPYVRSRFGDQHLSPGTRRLLLPVRCIVCRLSSVSILRAACSSPTRVPVAQHLRPELRSEERRALFGAIDIGDTGYLTLSGAARDRRASIGASRYPHRAAPPPRLAATQSSAPPARCCPWNSVGVRW